MIRFERRQEASWIDQLIAYVVAIVAGFAVSALLVLASGADVVEGFSALYDGAFGSAEAIGQSLVAAIPLIFTGLATVVAFRAGIWNIGQEGQMFAGAMAGYWASLHMAGVPMAFAVPVVILAAITGGAALSAFCAFLRARFEVNEIISTMMMNYIIIYLLSYLLAGGPWTEAGSTAYHQTPIIADNFHLPEVGGLPASALLALIATVGLAILIARTPLGFELRGLGFNPTALRYKGVRVGATVVTVMALSGALSALAGVSEVFGLNFRLRAEVLTGLGYTGIIVGMIGALNPWGTLVAALLFGALTNGALYMNVLTDVPSALVPAMQGILLLFVLGASVLVRYRIRFAHREAADV
jgi:general nucleoside transport system permease protein